MNDESATPRNEGRVSRAAPEVEPRPVDRGSLADSGILPSEDIAESDFDIKFAAKRCVLCDYAEVAFETKEEMDAHVRHQHRRKPDAARDDTRPCVTHCDWVCSVCGKEYRYPVDGEQHGGPVQRSFDRRFAFAYCLESRYPEHKRTLGRIDGAAGPVIFYHKGMTFSEQPVQDDPTLQAFLPQKKENNGRKSSPRNASPRRLRAGESRPSRHGSVPVPTGPSRVTRASREQASPRASRVG